MIKFGTGGWRAIIADEFTKANIRLLTAGTAVLLYLLLRDPKKVFEPWKNRKDAIDFVIFSIFFP